MKKISKILLPLTLVLVAFVGLIGFTGCGSEGKKVVNIGLNKEIKTQYDVNEELNLEGLELIISFNNYTQENIKITNDMVTGFDTKTLGPKQMVIKYLDNSLTINYTVLADIDLNAVYYQTPFMLAQQFDYGYLKFVSETEAYLIGSEETPENAISKNIFTGDTNKYTFTKSVVNNHYVYSSNLVIGEYTMQATLTVLDETQVKLNIVEETSGTNKESTFAKYV